MLVAFSGGADSLCLLHFLNENKNLFKIKISAAYVEHNLRGAESKADGDFCERFCKEKGIEFYKENIDVKSFAKKEKISTEEAARTLRYGKLTSLAEKIGANLIATGHNANDNAETVLLNVIKGKSVSSIAGIPYKRGKIIRPLLNLTREEILIYLKEYNLSYRTDSTNLENDYQRNYLRNEIIPLIKSGINQNLEATLLKNSFAVREQLSFLRQTTEHLFKNYVRKNAGYVEVSLEFIDDYGSGSLAEVVKKTFRAFFQKEATFEDIKAITALVKNRTGKRLILSKNVTVVKERNALVLYKESGASFTPVEIKAGEKVKTELGEISLKFVEPDEVNLSRKSQNTEFVDAENFNEKFILRTWQHGDKFVPLGMKSPKKVSDILTDRKISSHLKRKYLVLLNNGEIVWLVGVAICEKFKITKKTKRVLKLCLN